MTVEEYGKEIEALVTLAFDKGGAVMQDRVWQWLGVAVRHLQRIHVGTLQLAPGVEWEIAASIADAKERLTLGGE